MFDYIFILYSCKKNLDKTNKIYDKINNKLHYSKVYIIYGDELDINEKYKIIDDKYIILNVKDDYDNLNEKTLSLIQTINMLFPSIKGMFKCDDDVIVNIGHIQNMIYTIQNENIDYCGHYNIIDKDKTTYDTYECTYCGGPLYFLSKKAIECFNETSDIKKIYYEDMMIGYHLNKFNIFPSEKYNLYSNNIYDSDKISYHNYNHYEELYMIIQGGLGNQLFQLGCAMKMAEKYNKKFMLIIKGILPNPHQNNNIVSTIYTIKQLFPDIPICDKKLFLQEFYNYQENKNECFLFTEEKLHEIFNIYNNIILNGYFINYKYVPTTIFEKIKVTPTNKKLLTFDFTNVYFIHIRLGDYLKNKMYQINLKSYYNYCINKILELNVDAKFIICTNQYDIYLQNYLKDFPKNMKFKIQDKSNNDMDTLYIMSSCCGAICSNSTLSFMGALFQKEPKKKEHIYMPYPFVNFIDGFNQSNVTREMYPEWCTIYNTLNNRVYEIF